MRNIKIFKILLYYDIPELFIGVDSINTKYLCMCTGRGSSNEYLIVPCSQNRINKIEKGNIDIRKCFIDSELGDTLLGELSGDELSNIGYIETNQITEDILPEEDLFINDINQEDDIIDEAIQKNNSIVHISFSDEENGNTLPISVLGDFLNNYQTLLKYAYKRYVSGIKGKIKEEIRQSINKDLNYQFNIFNTSPGSFKVHLESKSEVGLFGDTRIESALHIIDEILNENIDSRQRLEILKKYKGHMISVIKNLSKILIQEKINLKYEWCSPGEKRIYKESISISKAETLLELILMKDDLEEEIKELTGYVIKVDIAGAKHSWKIKNEEDDKIYSGETEIDLSGITINTVKYKFICEEKNEKGVISGNEETKFKLLSFEILDA